MAEAGLYRRILPSPPAIEFASPEGKSLFSDALQNGTMEGFFKLISYFQTQSEPAYCGLATLSVVLNALAIDPGRKWKGPWRWFDETMLDCCEPLEKIKAEGITFGKVACLANCAGAKVEAFRANQTTVDDFRKRVIQCTSSEDCHMVVTYDRKPFKQTGSGHFSPIGGYHSGKDMVLILDVARFKYPPHWAPLELLWEAMNTIDKATGCLRGFMLISRFQKASSSLYTLSCRHESWVSMVKYLIDDVPIILKSESLGNAPAVVSLLIKYLPANAGDFIKWFAEVRRREEGESRISKEEKERLVLKEEVLQQVYETQLYKVVKDVLLSSANPWCTNLSFSNDKDSLPEIAATLCCQGAAVLTGKVGGSEEFCCSTASVNCVTANGNGPTTIISGTVVSDGKEQGVDMLVPVSPKKSSCCCSGLSNGAVMHPASDNVLTVLLLALPPRTWLDIEDKRLLAEIQGLFSAENLPDVLQDEVLHLRRQLDFLKRCKDKEVDDDPILPSHSQPF